MLLAIDIGNTNIVIGAHQTGTWQHVWRIQTEPEKEAGAYLEVIRQLMNKHNMSFNDVSQVIISSVVPRLSEKIRRAFVGQAIPSPIVVNGTLDSGIMLKTDDPSAVGADLIADAAGAYHLFGGNSIIVDFGTATTVMVVEEPGVLTGGAICAGLKVSMEALVEKTALLPSVSLEVPMDAIGSNTVEAMQSGIVLGHLCMVEGLIDRMSQKLGEVNVIATGGLSTMLARHSDYFDAVDPLLTLNGLRVIAERYKNKDGEQ